MAARTAKSPRPFPVTDRYPVSYHGHSPGVTESMASPEMYPAKKPWPSHASAIQRRIWQRSGKIRAKARLLCKKSMFRGFSHEECKQSLDSATFASVSSSREAKEENRLERNFFTVEGLSCTRCTLTFSSGTHLEKHKRFCCNPSVFVQGRVDPSIENALKEPSSGMLMCPCCTLLCINMAALQKHLSKCREAKRKKDAEKEIIGFPCPECSLLYSSLKNLIHHLCSHYIGDIICTPCNKNFRGFKSLYQHLEMCKSREYYKCCDCNKMFIDAFHLRRHLPLCTSQTQCLKCAETVDRKTCLNHMTSHLHAEWSKLGLKLLDGTVFKIPEKTDSFITETTPEKIGRLQPGSTGLVKLVSPSLKSVSPSGLNVNPVNLMKPMKHASPATPGKPDKLDGKPTNSKSGLLQTTNGPEIINGNRLKNSSTILKQYVRRYSCSSTDSGDDDNISVNFGSCSNVGDDDPSLTMLNEFFEIENDLANSEFTDEPEISAHHSVADEQERDPLLPDLEVQMDRLDNLADIAASMPYYEPHHAITAMDVPEVPLKDVSHLFTPAVNESQNGEDENELTLTVVNVEGGANLFDWGNECEEISERPELNENPMAFATSELPISSESVPNTKLGSDCKTDKNEDGDSGIDGLEDRDSNNDQTEDFDVCNETVIPTGEVKSNEILQTCEDSCAATTNQINMFHPEVINEAVTPCESVECRDVFLSSSVCDNEVVIGCSAADKAVGKNVYKVLDEHSYAVPNGKEVPWFRRPEESARLNRPSSSKVKTSSKARKNALKITKKICEPKQIDEGDASLMNSHKVHSKSSSYSNILEASNKVVSPTSSSAPDTTKKLTVTSSLKLESSRVNHSDKVKHPEALTVQVTKSGIPTNRIIVPIKEISSLKQTANLKNQSIPLMKSGEVLAYLSAMPTLVPIASTKKSASEPNKIVWERMLRKEQSMLSHGFKQMATILPIKEVENSRSILLHNMSDVLDSPDEAHFEKTSTPNQPLDIHLPLSGFCGEEVVPTCSSVPKKSTKHEIFNPVSSVSSNTAMPLMFVMSSDGKLLPHPNSLALRRSICSKENLPPSSSESDSNSVELNFGKQMEIDKCSLSNEESSMSEVFGRQETTQNIPAVPTLNHAAMDQSSVELEVNQLMQKSSHEVEEISNSATTVIQPIGKDIFNSQPSVPEETCDTIGVPSVPTSSPDHHNENLADLHQESESECFEPNPLNSEDNNDSSCEKSDSVISTHESKSGNSLELLPLNSNDKLEVRHEESERVTSTHESDCANSLESNPSKFVDNHEDKSNHFAVSKCFEIFDMELWSDSEMAEPDEQETPSQNDLSTGQSDACVLGRSEVRLPSAMELRGSDEKAQRVSLDHFVSGGSTIMDISGLNSSSSVNQTCSTIDVMELVSMLSNLKMNVGKSKDIIMRRKKKISFFRSNLLPSRHLMVEMKRLKRTRYGREGLLKNTNSGRFNCSHCTQYFHCCADVEQHVCCKFLIQEKFTSELFNRFFDGNNKEQADDDKITPTEGEIMSEKETIMSQKEKVMPEKEKLQQMNEGLSPLETYFSMKSQKMRRFPCEKCNLKFKTFSALYNHKQTEHTEKSKLKCHVCGKEFSRLQKLAVHFAKSHKQHASEKEVDSQVLDTASSESSVDIKSQTSNIEASSNCKEKVVDVNFEVGDDLVRNIQVTRTQTGSQTNDPSVPAGIEADCDLKGKSEHGSTEISSVQETIPISNSDAGVDEATRCKICSKVFSAKGGLKSHMNQVHCALHKCPVCLRKFTYVATLRVHFMRHFDEGVAEGVSSKQGPDKTPPCQEKKSDQNSDISMTSFQLLPTIKCPEDASENQSMHSKYFPVKAEEFLTAIGIPLPEQPKGHLHQEMKNVHEGECKNMVLNQTKKRKKTKWKIIKDSSSESKSSPELDTTVPEVCNEKDNAIEQSTPKLKISLGKVKKSRYVCQDCDMGFKKAHHLALHRLEVHVNGPFMSPVHCAEQSDMLQPDIQQVQNDAKVCRESGQISTKPNSNGFPIQNSRESKQEKIQSSEEKIILPSETVLDTKELSEAQILRESAQVVIQSSEIDTTSAAEVQPPSPSPGPTALEVNGRSRRKIRNRIFKDYLPTIPKERAPKIIRNRQTWKCEECEVEFRFQLFLERHKIHKHGAPCKFKCQYCGKIFLGLNQLKFHHKTKHLKRKWIDPDEIGENSSDVPSSTCAQASDSNTSTDILETENILTLECHLTGDVPSSSSLSEKAGMPSHCDLPVATNPVAPSSSELPKKPVQTISVRSGKNLRKCKYCSKTFRRGVDLKKHYRTKHHKRPSSNRSGPKTMSLESCSDTIGNSQQEPSSSVHPKNSVGENYNDQKLTRSSKRKFKILEDNEEVQFPPVESPEDTTLDEGTEIFKCTDCPLMYRTPSCLKRHRILIHAEPASHYCHICGKGFSYPHSLKNHVMTHSRGVSKMKRSERPDKRKKCHQCDNVCHDEEHYSSVSETNPNEAGEEFCTSSVPKTYPHVEDEEFCTSLEQRNISVEQAASTQSVVELDMTGNDSLPSERHGAEESIESATSVSSGEAANLNNMSQELFQEHCNAEEIPFTSNTISNSSEPVSHEDTVEKNEISQSTSICPLNSEVVSHVNTAEEKETNYLSTNCPLVRSELIFYQETAEKNEVNAFSKSMCPAVGGELGVVPYGQAPGNYFPSFTPTESPMHWPVPQATASMEHPVWNSAPSNHGLPSYMPASPAFGTSEPWRAPSMEELRALNACSLCGLCLPSWYALQEHYYIAHPHPNLYDASTQQYAPQTVSIPWQSPWQSAAPHQSWTQNISPSKAYEENASSLQELTSDNVVHCSVCGLCFHTLFALQEHYATHMATPRAPSFPCSGFY